MGVYLRRMPFAAAFIVIYSGGLYFNVVIPTAKPVFIHDLSKEELDAEIEKGYAEMPEGKAEPAGQVFDELLNEDTVFGF